MYFFAEEKPAVEEADGAIMEPRYLWGLSKRVESGTSLVVKETGLAEPETMEREQNLVGLRQRGMDKVRREILLSRRWCMRLFVVMRLKSSVLESVMMGESVSV